MITYAHIDRLKNQIENAIDDLKNSITTDFLRDIRDELQVIKSEDNIHYSDAQYIKERQMMGRLYVYLINGIDYDTAIRQIEVDFNTPIYEFIDWITTVHTRYINNLRPYKIYAAHKLHAAGISNVKIAELLKVHPYTVARFLRIKSDFKD